MSPTTLLSLAPVPCLDLAVTLLTASYTNVQKISVYRRQCEDLAGQCVELILSVQEGSEGIEGTRALALADKLTPVCERICIKTREWAEWGPLKCFLQQSDLKDDLDRMQRQLNAAIMQFSTAMNLELHRGYQEARAIQQATRAEVRSALQAILESHKEMSKLLATSENSLQPVNAVMMRLQEELRDSEALPPEQNEAFRRGLWTLHQKTSRLPPLADLTGQVELDSRHPEFIGTYNDVYIGTWLDNKKVAVRLPRTLSDVADVHKRFKKEAELWRTLQHPNVLPLYGIVYLGKHVYSVSPWMFNGTAIGYVQRCPEANIMRMLSEVAAGLAYLHDNQIVHGDLRGANVLIAEDGTAKLSDFGLSKFLADCNKGLTVASSINPRWFAPEILRDKPLSKQSDIWALGMTFLELLTGKQPYHNIVHDIAVQEELSKSKHPKRPEGPDGSNVSDRMWELLKRCWSPKPESRPTIQQVQDALSQIRGEISPNSPNSKKRFTSLLSNPMWISGNAKVDGRPGTSGSDMSSNSSGSARMPSLREVSKNRIQEYDDELSPLPLSPQSELSTSPYSTRPPISIRQTRRPSEASEYGHSYTDTHGRFLPSGAPLSSSPRIELTSPTPQPSQPPTRRGTGGSEISHLYGHVSRTPSTSTNSGSSGSPSKHHGLTVSNDGTAGSGAHHRGLASHEEESQHWGETKRVSLRPEPSRNASYRGRQESLPWQSNSTFDSVERQAKPSEPPRSLRGDPWDRPNNSSQSLRNDTEESRSELFSRTSRQPTRRETFGSVSGQGLTQNQHQRSNAPSEFDDSYIDLSRAPKLELEHIDKTPMPMMEEAMSSYESTTRNWASGSGEAGPSRTATGPPRSLLSVNTLNEDPLLQIAVSDPDRSVVYVSNTTGKVIAGTLEALVDRLVDNFNLRKDEEFRDVILTACIDFITPEDLFSMLQWRFDEAERDTQRHPADRVATQYNVFMVIMYWIRGRHLPVDSALLWQMRNFCESALLRKTSTKMISIANELIRLIDERPPQDQLFARTPLAPGTHLPTGDEVTPLALAIALTILEGDKFKQIMPSDYLANQVGIPGFNAVDLAIRLNNKIIQWVKNMLLYYDAVKHRATVLKFFINTAKECRRLRNFQSLMAIVVALDSTPVRSLELTRNYIEPNLLSQLDELVKLPNPEGNHKRYRQALNQVIDPEYRNNCIPWIAVHLKELHAVLHSNRRVVQIKPGRPLINVERYTKFLDTLKQVFPQQPPDFDSYRQQGALAYLEDKLDKTTVGEEIEDRLYAKSENVRAVEQQLGELRVVERGKLGFHVPKRLKHLVDG